MSESGRRRRLDVLDTSNFHPRYVVWELTLRCDHACTHCRSRAGVARESELTTEEALEMVDQLAEMGANEVVLRPRSRYTGATKGPAFTIVAGAARPHVAPISSAGSTRGIGQTSLSRPGGPGQG